VPKYKKNFLVAETAGTMIKKSHAPGKGKETDSREKTAKYGSDCSWVRRDDDSRM